MKKIFILMAAVFSIVLISGTCKKNKATTTSTTVDKGTASAPKKSSKKKSKVEFVDTVLRWTDYESGYAKAVAENKMLLVDVYTDWCGWCKVMDRKTYTNDSVIYFINKYFVAIKLNPEVERNYTFNSMTKAAPDLHAWLGYGDVFGFPSTYFVIDPGKSDQRNYEVGYIETAPFLQILKQRIALKTN